MKMAIRSVEHPLLRDYIQYYVFTEYAGSFAYRTFPNTNLCLALYRQNRIEYSEGAKANSCVITGGGPAYGSALWGWHRKPFEVKVEGPSEQVCIVFHPGGLRKFTTVPFTEVLKGQEALEPLFGPQAHFLPEQLFGVERPEDKVALLESFLLGQLARRRQEDGAVDWAARQMIQRRGGLRVEELARALQFNPSTLYRRFMNDIGQPPKEFLSTVQFRAALAGISARRAATLTQVGYDAEYFDQSHFIKSFRKMTGLSPAMLQKRMSTVEGRISWVVE